MSEAALSAAQRDALEPVLAIVAKLSRAEQEAAVSELVEKFSRRLPNGLAGAIGGGRRTLRRGVARLYSKALYDSIHS